jgi:hypothetical protein
MQQKNDAFSLLNLIIFERNQPYSEGQGQKKTAALVCAAAVSRI